MTRHPNTPIQCPPTTTTTAMLPSLGRHKLLPLLWLLMLLQLLLPAVAFNGRCPPQRPQQRLTQEPQPPHRPVAADKPLGSGSRARRPSSFDRREALRAGSALAIGLAVLGSTSGGSGSRPGMASSAAQAAAAEAPSALLAIPGKGDVDILHDGSVTPSTSTLLGTAAAAPAAGAGAEAASSPLADFISGLAGGAASRASKELLLHPLDTIRTRLQYAKGDEPPAELFKDLYDGVWPALIVGTPAGAAFFATKDVLKNYAKQTFGSEYRELTTIAAVFLANFPYWAIRNPAEVLKTQQQAGLVGGSAAAVKEAVAREGLDGLYRGFGSNVLYAFPTDAIKFVVYEALQRSFTRKLNPLESSVCGSAASCVAQLCSTPLDVLRTRIMTQEDRQEGGEGEDEGEQGSASVLGTARAIVEDEGVGKLFSGLAPRLARAVLSGAIQFGSYELTKGAFAPASSAKKQAA